MRSLLSADARFNDAAIRGQPGKCLPVNLLAKWRIKSTSPSTTMPQQLTSFHCVSAISGQLMAENINFVVYVHASVLYVKLVEREKERVCAMIIRSVTICLETAKR